MVYVFLAEGFEEIEALTPVDLMRRAGLEVGLAGVGGLEITGSHGISVKADLLAEEADMAQAEAIVLPGGMPGTTNLKEDENVRKAVQEAYDDGRYVAAICAAPTILADMGLLKGKRATCYPDMESEIEDAYLTGAPVATDENIITSQGVGTAIDFALKLIEALISEEKAVEIADSIAVSYTHLTLPTT